MNDITTNTAIPDLMNHVIGFRSWNINFDGKTLSSAHGSWLPNENSAVCGKGQSHTPPAADCKCGLYAYHGLYNKQAPYGDVYGAVKASGKLSVAPTGFRAEKAEIIAITMADLTAKDLLETDLKSPGDEEVLNLELSTLDLLTPVALFYDVPVIPWDELEEFAFNLGVGGAIPKEMIPKDTVRYVGPKRSNRRLAQRAVGSVGMTKGDVTNKPINTSNSPSAFYRQVDTNPNQLLYAGLIVWVVLIIIAACVVAGTRGII